MSAPNRQDVPTSSDTHASGSEGKNWYVRILSILLNALGFSFVVFAYFMEVLSKHVTSEFESRLGAAPPKPDYFSIEWMPLLCLPAFFVAGVACARYSKFWAVVATLLALTIFVATTQYQ